ncbi:hypothetical protein JQ636_38340 [Bradyrhizobium japonicum]|uniref:hypothetical protein n=1 Tax=Bradyrhizobium japonicum TaxID=375 RepID=UPI001BA81E47|nr:hypothetical protein [Bradyrhizobium japonicum]MBR0735167.1 hypothetical protein [Bradyrhizobium japonicum]MBR0809424.1 hypothetical protein [Bradyrhizobium japonicum]
MTSTGLSKELNAFRQRRDVVLSLNELPNRARIEWHGVTLKQPGWSNHLHSLAFTPRSLRARFLLHRMLNAYWEPLTFELPGVPAGSPRAWRRCIDTTLKPPNDISSWETAAGVWQTTYVVQRRSVVLLAAGAKPNRRDHGNSLLGNEQHC